MGIEHSISPPQPTVPMDGPEGPQRTKKDHIALKGANGSTLPALRAEKKDSPSNVPMYA